MKTIFFRTEEKYIFIILARLKEGRRALRETNGIFFLHIIVHLTQLDCETSIIITPSTATYVNA